MKGTYETGWSGLVGSRVIPRLLAASRELRTKAESPTWGSKVRDDGERRSDAAAGSEYVDDRIRLRE